MSEAIVRRADELTIKQLKDQLTEKDKQIEELKDQSKRQSENYKHDCGVLLRNIAELEAQIEKMSNCLNCAFWKEKKYNVCREIKKLGKTCCTFWKLNE